MKVSHLFKASFILTFIFFSFLSCSDDDDNAIISEEGRCQFARVDGIAKINDINRWLSLADVVIGVGGDRDLYKFTVGGHTPDCSLYEEIEISLELEAGNNVDGTYPIVEENSQMLGTSYGRYTTQEEGSFEREVSEFTGGSFTINEIGLFRYMIELEAETQNGTINPITLEFSQPPR